MLKANFRRRVQVKIIFWIITINLLCTVAVWSGELSSSQKELEAIEQEIKILKEQWRQINLKQMQEDVEGQKYMIADWRTYSEKMELIRKQEEEDNRIEIKIKELEEKKAQLLKSKYHHHFQ